MLLRVLPLLCRKLVALDAVVGDLCPREVLLLDLSSPERVPDSYSDLLPKPWVEIEASLKKGETIELEGEARQMRTVLLAAPTRAALVSLMKDSKLIR